MSYVPEVTFIMINYFAKVLAFFLRNKFQNIVHTALHNAANFLNTFEGNALVML